MNGMSLGNTIFTEKSVIYVFVMENIKFSKKRFILIKYSVVFKNYIAVMAVQGHEESPSLSGHFLLEEHMSKSHAWV